MSRLLFGVLFTCLATGAAAEPPHGALPKEGFIPNAEVAVRIAIAVWEPIYGAANIERQKPFTATLTNGVWRVAGTAGHGWAGGVALAEIAQADGRILRVSHGR